MSPFHDRFEALMALHAEDAPFFLYGEKVTWQSLITEAIDHATECVCYEDEPLSGMTEDDQHRFWQKACHRLIDLERWSHERVLNGK